jgi:putative PIN family toxin of toxin-antitoxin system
MMRVVLDANVLVSAILSPRGTPAQILTAWRAKQFDLVVSEAILAEIVWVFRYPKIAKRHRWSEEQLQTFLDNLSHIAILTPGTLTLDVITDDPPDNRYLEAAVEGEAAYIVSGDQLLLHLGAYHGILILTPRVLPGSAPETAEAVNGIRPKKTAVYCSLCSRRRDEDAS